MSGGTRALNIGAAAAAATAAAVAVPSRGVRSGSSSPDSILTPSSPDVNSCYDDESRQLADIDEPDDDVALDSGPTQPPSNRRIGNRSATLTNTGSVVSRQDQNMPNTTRSLSGGESSGSECHDDAMLDGKDMSHHQHQQHHNHCRNIESAHQENVGLEPQSPSLEPAGDHTDSQQHSTWAGQVTEPESEPEPRQPPLEFVGLNETSNRRTDLFVNISPSAQNLAQLLASSDNAATPVQNEHDLSRFESSGNNNDTIMDSPPVEPQDGGPSASASSSRLPISVVTANGTPVSSSNFETIPVPEHSRASAEFARRAKEQHSKIKASADSSLSKSKSKSSKSHSEKSQATPYSIRLSPFVDHSANVPSFYVQAVERYVKPDTTIDVGRYDARKAPYSEAQPPIVFKSKVVSRSHAQLSVNKEGQWFIRDVGSSSGTMINRARLSQANEASPPAPIKDGDILQFGVDYRGGLEEAFRCIKVYVELNRSWKRKASGYNKSALDRLRNLTIGADSSTEDNSDTNNNAQSGSILTTKDASLISSSSPITKTPSAKQLSSDVPLQECVICLQPLGACQALFVGPCSHGWHYKCIRPIIVRSYPHFLCPNCRTMWDLEADIDESEDSSDANDDEDDE